MEADSLAQERFSIHGQSLLGRIFLLKYLGRPGGNQRLHTMCLVYLSVSCGRKARNTCQSLRMK